MTSFNSGSRCWSADAMPDSSAPASTSAMRAQSGSHVRADECERIVEREFLAFRITAIAVLEFACFQSALTDNHAMRNPQQLRIREFDPRAGVAVVVQHLDSGGSEFGIQPVGDLAYPCGFLHAHRHQHDLEGCNRLRPDDAALIVILLDGGGHDARHTDAVAAHVQGHFLATFIEYHTLHGLAVLLPELEDVTDFDAPGDLQAPMPGWAGIAFDHVANVGGDHSLHIPVPVGAGEMHVLFVGPADEVRQRQGAVIHVDAATETDGADEASLGARRPHDALGAGHAQGTGHSREVLRFDGVELVITADHHRHHIVLGAIHE